MLVRFKFDNINVFEEIERDIQPGFSITLKIFLGLVNLPETMKNYLLAVNHMVSATRG